MGPTGAMITYSSNYTQVVGSQVTIASTDTLPAIVVSATITSQGNPIQIIVSGDANPLGAGAWGILQIFRSTTEIGGKVHYESSNSNENNPFSLVCIDNPAAGTYTYSLKVTNLTSNTQFGESTGPVITLVELSGARGVTGPPASDATEWTTYTPTWTAATNNPSLGDGIISGRYKAIGKTIFVRIHMQVGSSTTFGSGHWKFSLPVAAYSGTSVVLSATYLDSGTQWYSGVATTEYDSNTGYVVPITASSGTVIPTIPFTWAPTDSITLCGSYESE
jgi:hypothetical protein